ncbi:MAG: ribonuclease R [Cytophagales bacterium]|nr:ribonuclease R [Cytophagales bacterium]MDW8384383.1 ribonuclease R [Flammeovirgaceae bacterium]
MGRELKSSLKQKEKKTKSAKKQKASPTLGFSEQSIIDFFQERKGTIFSLQQLIKAFDLRSRKEKSEFKACLKKLVNHQQIAQYQGRYGHFLEPQLVEGIVDYVSPQYAYIIVEGQETDIFVPTSRLKHALDGDRVLVEILPSSSPKRIEGSVRKIIERKRTDFVGELQIVGQYAFLISDLKKMHFDIYIPKEHIKGAQNGDKVIVKLIRWQETDKNPIGKVVKVLGKVGDNDAEIHAIMAEYNLPWEFPEEVKKAAEKIPSKIPKAEINRRRDFRNVPTFTIDPINAKDFDDALSIRRLENGNWEVGIHIADVTYYVKPDSLLEKEAQQRATSVYLVDRVIPMLPEKLSNELCSLRPEEDKLTFSAVFELDVNAKVLSEWFGRTIIRSRKRFTYEEAQTVLETQQGEWAEELITLNQLARKLREKRFKAGSIGFESPEFYFELDEHGKPLRIIPKVRKDAHKLIEEFMLLANRHVAEFVYKKKKGKQLATFVYRTHDDPDPEKVQQFSMFVKRFGFEFNPENPEKIARALNMLSAQIEGHPCQASIEAQAIRAMAKAKYTTEPLKHYGLGFKHYTHFTSPIRRYPDIMAHRLLQHYLEGGAPVSKADYEPKCKHASDMERRAAEAERASIKYKQCEFMQQFIGREFEGIISGTTEWGIYVEIIETKCEGMARLNSLKDDFYYYDSDSRQVIGQKYKNTFSIGDRVWVRVKGTDLNKRTIDLEIINPK